ncbi:MAG: N-acetylmuramoyl-L-alanine amidase [Saprospiraceae bacterium]|nr:N-acetylmuramoyl-L-alanine amidase [Saprospiraceae bacterium]
MSATKVLLQTIIFSILPFSLGAFNTFLSPPGTAESSGKVIKESPKAKNPFRLQTVVIDPGHGGHDPGCLGKRSREKHLALAVSKNLASMIREHHPDTRVIMTRDEDVFIPLHERAAIANRNQADLFISIHCNFFPNRPDIRGSETYVMGLHTADHNLEVAKRENASILLETDYEKNYDYDPNSPEGHILLSMFQNAYLEQSIMFAEKVENSIKQHAKRHSRGVKQAGFVVLKETTMPSVLVETGFLSHSREESFLLTSQGQRQIAAALLRAFSEYKAEMEGGALPVEIQQPVAVKRPPEKTERPAPAQARTVSREVAVNPPPPPPPRLEDSRATITTPPQKRAFEEKTPIRFHVQLAASSGRLETRSPKWERLTHTVEIVRENGLNKYQIRNFDSLETALGVKNMLRQEGFPDAFLVAYKGAQKITIKQAKSELGLQ